MKLRTNPLLVLLAASGLLPLVASGATLYWDGDVATANNTSENTSTTAMTWLNGGNWDNGTTSAAKTSWTSGDVAIFGGNTGGSVQTVTLASGILLGNGSIIGNTTGLYKISVTGTGYNQLGNPSGSFTINAGSTVSADAASNNAHNIGALTLNGGTLTSINGPGGAANDGGYGNWLLRGAVTVGGSTLSTISSTTLYINNAGASFTVADSVAGTGTDLLISSSVLSGGTAINKAGAGTMEMTGPIAGTSAINVNEGTLKLKGPNNNSTAYANGTISIASGATLTIDRTIPYGLGKAHTAAITNAGTLNWGKYESVSSAITLDGGTINVFGSGYGTYYQGAQLYNGNISTLANANSSVIQAGDAAGDNSIHLLAGTKNGNKGVLVTVADGNAADDLLISARLANESGDAGSAAGVLTKEGAGVLKLSGANTYTGVTTINGGTIKVANTTALGTAAAGTTVNSTGILDLNGTNIGSEIVTLAGGTLGNTSTSDGIAATIIVNSASSANPANGWIQINNTSGSGSLEISSANDKGIYTQGVANWSHTGGTTLTSGHIDLYNGGSITGGPVTVNGGTLKTVGADMIGNNLSVTINGGTWQLGGSDTIGSLAGTGGTVSLQTNTLTTGDATNTGYAGVISGTGGMVKQGSGSMTLSGASTYNGATTVSAGTLLVTGSLGDSAITVGSSGTVGGNGVLNGNLAFDAGANLDLTGAVIGLTSTNILSVASNRTISFANLTFADLVGWNYADAALGTYTLINGGSSVSFGSTSAISAATAYDFGNGKKGYFREGSLQVVIIPETSATLLLGIGALGFALRRRRA